MVNKDLAIGFIGIGVLGKGLPLALTDRGYRVAGAYSRSSNSAQWLADRIPGCDVYPSAQGLANAADLAFITTPDSIIGEVAAAVDWRPGQAVVHCCGAASTGLLAPAKKLGALTGAFHPFQTFAGVQDPKESSARLAGVTFAIAGDGWLVEYLRDMARVLGGYPVVIADELRPMYHAAAVLGCGYLVALFQGAVSLWEEMGFSAEEAIRALYPLANATLDNVSRHGMAVAATGPVIRGDAVTLRSHLESLFLRMPELLPVYSSLARASFPLAVKHGVGPDQLTAMEELVDHYVEYD
jgi:predicted short-subunit dehydrogenase-like oxidoreductase (DUF2520 family)